MVHIWSAGIIMLDVVADPIEHWPEHGKAVSTRTTSCLIGGVALNTAVTIARLGDQFIGLVGCIGNDLAGTLVRQELDQLHVDTSHLTILDGPSTGICIVAIHPDGERSLIGNTGATDFLTSETANLRGVTPGDLFHIGGAIGVKTLSGDPLFELLNSIQATRARISVDTTFDTRGAWWAALEKSLPLVEILTTNHLEARLLTGLSDPVTAAHYLLDTGPRTVAVKLGPNGCYLISPDWEGHVPSFAVTAVDTTGAGDSFSGALLYGLARNWPTEQAATFACAVGALCVQKRGATAGIPPYPQVLTFIDTHDRAASWNWSNHGSQTPL